MAYKEYPILFNGEAVRAVLKDRKTQTRRPIKAFDHSDTFVRMEGNRAIFRDDLLAPVWAAAGEPPDFMTLRCPYGQPGDRLWVREAWRVGAWNDNMQIAVDYRADGYARREWLDVPDEGMFERLWIQSSDDALAAGIVEGPDGLYHWMPGEAPTRWRPSIHMPRWTSRIMLEVTDVRVQRVQEITDDDAWEEGAWWWAHDDAVGPPFYVRKGYNVECFSQLWDSIYAKPKPVYRDKAIAHYVSYPWEPGTKTRDHRGLPWFVHGNPRVWTTSFKGLEDSRRAGEEK